MSLCVDEGTYTEYVIVSQPHKSPEFDGESVEFNCQYYEKINADLLNCVGP